MELEFDEGLINFDATPGRQEESATLLFGGNVIRASAALTAVNVRFEKDPEPLRGLNVGVSEVSRNMNSVLVRVLVELDGTSTAPLVSGSVGVLVLAQVE